MKSYGVQIIGKHVPGETDLTGVNNGILGLTNRTSEHEHRTDKLKSRVKVLESKNLDERLVKLESKNYNENFTTIQNSIDGLDVDLRTLSTEFKSVSNLAYDLDDQALDRRISIIESSKYDDKLNEIKQNIPVIYVALDRHQLDLEESKGLIAQLELKNKELEKKYNEERIKSEIYAHIEKTKPKLNLVYGVLVISLILSTLGIIF
jgi:hypothetical protein